ncbi:MAG: glycosyltransferase [Bacteroidales bacterium]|jgi:glycosyltransferase involved in cell wall biosynthesis|nr:glycosyltransferase [Bacteroidales bacterium]
MKTIFIGCLYPREKEDEIRKQSKVGLNNSSNNLQWHLIKGLESFYDGVSIVTFPLVETYPLRNRKLIYNDYEFAHKPDSKDISLGFINLPLINKYSIYIKCKKYLKKLLQQDTDVTIFVYHINSSVLNALAHFKKNKKIKICLIVTDLPQFTSESKNIVYRFLKRIDSVAINKRINNNVDAFVLVNDKMKEYINTDNKPHVRIEGIFHSDFIPNKQQYSGGTKNILYTGNLGKRYGIKNLLDSFALIDNPNYQLWIRGNGAEKTRVLQAMKSDARIKYFEEMTRENLLQLLTKATVLINPTPPTNVFSQYNFPSKVMDYLASGTPVITTNLLCFPEEYFDYMFVAESEEPESLKKVIVKVCEMSDIERSKIGLKAKKFIFEEKNPIRQCEKIFEMLSHIEK